MHGRFRLNKSLNIINIKMRLLFVSIKNIQTTVENLAF